jgi:hypothetical protein
MINWLEKGIIFFLKDQSKNGPDFVEHLDKSDHRILKSLNHLYKVFGLKKLT